jgi:hypothetical protein
VPHNAAVIGDEGADASMQLLAGGGVGGGAAYIAGEGVQFGEIADQVQPVQVVMS